MAEYAEVSEGRIINAHGFASGSALGRHDDDTALIQGLLNDGAGREVYIPAGVYLVDPLNIPAVDGTVVRGAGPATKLILRPQDLDLLGSVSAVLNCNPAEADRVRGVVVRDLWVDGNYGNHTGTPDTNFLEGINIRYGDYCLVENVKVTNCEGDGIDVDTWTHGVVAFNYVENTRIGIHVSVNSARNLVLGNRVYDTRNAGIDQGVSGAVDNLYIGNMVDSAGTVNYDMNGSGALFFANQSSNGQTGDELDGLEVIERFGKFGVTPQHFIARYWQHQDSQQTAEGSLALQFHFGSNKEQKRAQLRAVREGSFANQVGMSIHTSPSASTLTERLRVTALGSILLAVAGALATNATDGFTYIPTCAGTPSGTPTAQSGMAPLVYDTSANKLWIYNGSWRSVTFA